MADTNVAEALLPTGETITVGKPPAAEFRRFLDRVTTEKESKSAAMLDLVMACVLTPERAEARKLLDEYPGLVVKLATVVQELAGGDIEVRVKLRG